MYCSKVKHPVMFIALIFTTAFFTNNVHAFSETAYVSASGVDNGTCSISAPCRTIDKAMEVICEEGFVFVLTTGEYLKANITKSINLIGAEGVTAKIDGVHIIPSTSDASILLRNLTIRQTTFAAVYVGSDVGNLEIDNCELINTNLGSARTGISIQYGGAYTLRNVKMRNWGTYGVYATGGGGLINLLIEGSTFEACGTGVFVRGNVKALVSDSSSNNNTTGFAVSFTGTGSARLMLEDVVATGNSGDGVYMYEGGVAYLSNSAISFNGYGVRATSGSYAYSYGNNKISRNTINTLGTINSISLQ